ncbi:UDP-N-acetylmuramoyl-L-alanyl-D-glutamate--2,6-diaminopimelate ligase [Paenibacillus darwinianus]|uniref:UDP-N-acetylmuramoyl-L-alanyl-D-glutamate--2, 6-diaminopimelate ligase n=1 Tax=Paenibacillus darwinianus TaxID=1380763 RepID=UPI000567543B|nr:UDP-N-acetylmuramoyl-L-alanyl-D-glutamate--2,6-diaminopimelate ligase [Paenibacillus darwinianus]
MHLRDALNALLLNSDSINDLVFSGIQFHSGKVNKGDLFVAIPGLATDGHDYIEDAIHSGAAAVVGEKDLHGLPVPYFRVSNARLALARLANAFYDQPSGRHTMIGITGTNGKTTTSYLLRYILESAGITCTLIGTVGHRINGVDMPSTQTTPDALQLQQWLNQSRDQAVIMEVSSHGIDQDRVGATKFDYAVFTNLSYDHLNYHKTMGEYFQTKARLFGLLKEQGEAVINSGCEWGARLIDQLTTLEKNVHTFGESIRDDVEFVRVISEFPFRFVIREGSEHHEIAMPIPGVYNAWNAAAAWLTARRIGVDASVIKEAIATFPGVAGRFEIYRHPAGARFVVDYAHTPDGFQQFLRTLHSLKPKRIIHVFGFRGNGDPSKRGLMLEISQAWSDLIILTLDNLSGMDGNLLLEETAKLADRYGGERIVVIKDRTKAIEYAWQEAGPDDWVAVTGKGHETYDQSFAFPSVTDRETIQYLSNRS